MGTSATLAVTMPSLSEICIPAKGILTWRGEDLELVAADCSRLKFFAQKTKNKKRPQHKMPGMRKHFEQPVEKSCGKLRGKANLFFRSAAGAAKAVKSMTKTRRVLEAEGDIHDARRAICTSATKEAQLTVLTPGGFLSRVSERRSNTPTYRGATQASCGHGYGIVSERG